MYVVHFASGDDEDTQSGIQNLEHSLRIFEGSHVYAPIVTLGMKIQNASQLHFLCGGCLDVAYFNFSSLATLIEFG